MSKSFIQFEDIIIADRPDVVLILGDTNSGLLSIIAEKHDITVCHMEAGNRCFNALVPEETNRRIIDNVSKYNLPYTENSKQNLLNEGFHKNNVFKTGNPIYEVLNYYEDKIDSSNILDTLNLSTDNFVLVTAHRAENVDNFALLDDIVNAINIISEQCKVIFSLHPRTRAKMRMYGVTTTDNVILSEPFGFFDFVKLEKNAKCVITDSGTCSEETCLFNVPSIIIRDSTERQELVECGSAVLTGPNCYKIVDAFNMLEKRSYSWTPPEDYVVKNVSDIVINILWGV